MARLWIITGTTRGLGAALAQAAQQAGDKVLGLSRQVGATGDTVIVDLAVPSAAASALTAALTPARLQAVDDVVLVNNAAVLGPIGSDFAIDEAARHYAINLLAPIALSQAFVTALADRAIRKRIINISSGAAHKPFAGWSLYGSSKAALEQFGRCLAAEQGHAKHPVEIVAISPGVIDTGMQAQIRACSDEQFPARGQFVEFQASGGLQSPQSVAQVLLRGAASDRFWAGECIALLEWLGAAPSAST